MRNDRCKTGVQDQINNGQPIIEFKTIAVPAGLTTIGIDLKVQWATPHKFFMVCSITSAVNDAMVALSLAPVNYQNGGTTQIVPTGGEQWIPLSNKQSSNGKVEGRWIKFERPVNLFYLTADHPSNNPASGQYFITLMGTDDIEAVIAERT